MKISKRQKQALKWILVAVCIGIIGYTFRDSAGPIFRQLKETAPIVVVGICLMSLVYYLIEGWITTALAKQYHSGFPYITGVKNALYCAFCRVATLGSGAGVAAIYYLGENGIDYSKGFGLYMLQYAFHKVGIAIFSAILFGLNFQYMCGHFGNYTGLLFAGYAITLIITACLILFCCSKRFHRLIFVLLDFTNRKLKGRLQKFTEELQKQCGMMEESSRFLLKKKGLIAGVLFLDFLKFGFWYGIPYLVFLGHAESTLSQVMAVTSLSVMLAAVIPAPAGIGSTEFVFTSLFAGIVGEGLAGSASLLYRFATFVFPFLVGALMLAVGRIRKKRREFRVK